MCYFQIAKPVVMKLIFIVSLLLFADFHVKAQSSSDSTSLPDPNTIYDVVDAAPEPDGGITEFYNKVALSVNYPQDARVKNITGKVFVQFVVEQDGKILPENTKVVRSVYQSLDDEAVRVVLLTSPWKPGMLHGKSVRTRKTFPISFNLGGPAPTKKTQ